MRTLLAVALLALVVAPGAAAAAPSPASGPVAADGTAVSPADHLPPAPATAATAGEHDACEPVADGPQREHPENDTLGWEAGCWYDDPIDVTVEEGLNQTELNATVARTMARVEHLRGLEFEQPVPVEVISRETYRERNRAAFDNASAEARLHGDVEYEALFFVGEDTAAVDEIESNRGGSVLGYYSPSRDRIVVVANDEEQLRMDELTLAHELVHALQDQQFDLEGYNRSTTEQRNALNGLIEGDARYVEQRYGEQCDAGWNCSTVDSSSGGVPSDFHWGIYFLNFQPYSDGPVFVERLRERNGWGAVDDAYRNPPASSEQIIHPDTYPDERPENVTVEDRSDDRWRPLEVEPGPVHTGADHVELGQAGVSTMFVYPAFDDGTSGELVTRREFSNSGSELDPLDYGNRYSEGWAGDRLVPYVTDESAVTGETGYVWKLAWDTEADAREFTEGYVRLLELHGGERVDGREGTYRIPDDRSFGDAFYVNRTGDTVVVVNAPTVDELPAVRAGAAPEPPGEPSPTPTSSSPDDGVEPAGETGTTATAPLATTTPGIGVVVALLALAVALLAYRSR